MPDARIALLRDNCERLLAALDEARPSPLAAPEQLGEWCVPGVPDQPSSSFVANPVDKVLEYAQRLGERYAESQRPVAELIAQLLQASQASRRASQRQQEQQTQLLAAGIQAYIHQLTSQLTEQAQRDPLTQLWNRAVFDLRLREEWSRAQRYQREFALVLFDLDQFKAINDRFGHPVGDEVLQRFAGFLRASLRQTDSAFRYGGDEFTALLPETGCVAARQVLERLAQRWREANRCSVVQPTVEISYGLAVYPHEATTALHLVQLADRRLYEHKHRLPDRSVQPHRSESQR